MTVRAGKGKGETSVILSRVKIEPQRLAALETILVILWDGPKGMATTLISHIHLCSLGAYRSSAIKCCTRKDCPNKSPPTNSNSYGLNIF